MAEPFKNRFDRNLVKAMAEHLARVSDAFDQTAFEQIALDGLEALELKARSNQIVAALEFALPKHFPTALGILLACLHTDDEPMALGGEISPDGIRGWAIMPMADYVAKNGLDHQDLSLEALRQMTSRFTAEFAIRPFIALRQEETLRVLLEWTRSENHHVRRLVSEGSRPRLPWGLRLKALDTDPRPLVPLLEALKDDPSEYVRRSVANSLNDISKTHPDFVVKITKQWLKGAGRDRQRLITHACRSLIKQGHRQTLELLGYRTPKLTAKCLSLSQHEVAIGEKLAFAIELNSTADEAQALIVDYIVHFQKAKGVMSPKVFKWKTLNLKARGSVTLSKAHHFRPVTTRKYYPGQQRIEIQINGEVIAGENFELKRALPNH